MDHGYAQTSTQLFNQLQSEGYSKKDRVFIMETYGFAMRLFSGLFLPSGKPFFDHLVGTASILASLRVPVEIVAAGLIHAAYLHGNFGGIRKGISEVTRRQVKNAVGEKVEEYVVRYERMVWGPETLPALCDAVNGMDVIDREVLLIHLANELEHNLDLGGLYFARSEKQQRARQHYIEHYGPMISAMAEKLGFPSLSTGMATVFGDMTAVQIPIEPGMTDTHDSGYLIVPQSYRERFGAVCVPKVRRRAWNVLNRVRRLYRKTFSLIGNILRTLRAGSS